MRIGLTLSGGGIRAAAFHLGVLARLAEDHLLEQIAVLSTVSGGSLATALIYAANDNRWPTREDLIYKVIPYCRHALTEHSLRRNLLARKIRSVLMRFEHSADDFAHFLETVWGVEGSLQDLPASPRWIINATQYETGNLWQFERRRMIDCYGNQSPYPKISVAAAVAASSAVPYLIGPLVIEAEAHHWYRYQDGRPASVKPPFTSIHLWDGSLYDNLGIEAIYNLKRGLKVDVDFLLVSDAAKPIPIKNFRPFSWHALTINMYQAQMLRQQIVEDYIERGNSTKPPFDNTRGRYIRYGNMPDMLLKQQSQAVRKDAAKRALKPEDLEPIAHILPLTSRLKPQTFDLLFRHGFEVTDFTLHGQGPKRFPLAYYNAERWQLAGIGAKRTKKQPALAYSADATQPSRSMASS